MKKLRSFIITTMLGGLLVVLPVVILIFVLNWLYEFITGKITPITQILIQTAKLNEIVASILAVILILFLFFLVGLAVRTRIGKYFVDFFENKLLKRIPFYKFIKETVVQIFGSNKTLFKYPVLVRLFSEKSMAVAFVTEVHPENMLTVFVPSGPAPTAGFVHIVKQEDTIKIDLPVDQVMRTIISLGKGSGEMIKNSALKESAGL